MSKSNAYNLVCELLNLYVYALDHPLFLLTYTLIYAKTLKTCLS